MFTFVFVFVFTFVFVFDTLYLLIRIAQPIQASGAGGSKNVKNASLWDRSNAMDSYCRITHEDNINVNQCKSM